MFNFKAPDKLVIRLHLGIKDGISLVHRDILDWPENFPIPRVGDYVHQNTNLRAEVMWVDYDYFLKKIDIFAGLIK